MGGFLLGIFMSALGYVISVARLPVVEEAPAMSSMRRDANARERLFQLRHRLRLLRFKKGSYLFFGTAMAAADAAVKSAARAEKEEELAKSAPAAILNDSYDSRDQVLHILVLDFTSVTGVDATAARTLSTLSSRLRVLPGAWHLVATGAQQSVASTLRAHGLEQGLPPDL